MTSSGKKNSNLYTHRQNFTSGIWINKISNIENPDFILIIIGTLENNPIKILNTLNMLLKEMFKKRTPKSGLCAKYTSTTSAK